MLQLSQKSKYALSFLSFLASCDPDQFFSIKSIALQTDLPYRFLATIAVDLKHVGIVAAKEGKGGGYFLNKPLNKISLKELIEAVEGKVGLVDCQLGQFCGSQGYCQNKGKWDEIRDEVAGVLGRYKVSEII